MAERLAGSCLRVMRDLWGGLRTGRLWRAGIAVLLCAAAQAQLHLDVPEDLSVPEPGSVRVEGVRPGAVVRLEAVRGDGPTSLAGQASYVADGEGRVDTRTAAPRDGSYTGADALGLFWSGRRRPAVAGDPPLGVVRVTAQAEGREAVSATARTSPNPALIVISRETPFPGAAWVRPRTPGRHPVVILLGGSEGGSGTGRSLAPVFAAQGYATLGLPYYDPGYDPNDRLPGLPHSFTEIPVDRLAAARAWIAKQTDADVSRLGVWGASKGAEFALIAASHYSWITAVVAVVPSDLVWEGWGRPGPPTSSFSIDGKALPFEPYSGLAEEREKRARGGVLDTRRIHVEGRAVHPERVAAARIPVERFHGALLVIGGGQDPVWPSAEMAENIAATRRAAGETTGVLRYPLAGHGLGGPGTSPAETPEAVSSARGRAEAWAATFRLFAAALRP